MAATPGSCSDPRGRAARGGQGEAATLANPRPSEGDCIVGVDDKEVLGCVAACVSGVAQCMFKEGGVREIEIER